MLFNNFITIKWLKEIIELIELVQTSNSNVLPESD